MAISITETLIRLLVGTVLGASIGYERQWSGRPAGLRTHLLVAVASTTFMLVSTQFLYYQQYTQGDSLSIDTSRIAASVVSGMGFLGAGAIIRTGFGIHGLTTAAGLWLVSAIGLAAGGGMYVEAVAATLVSLFALSYMRKFEKQQPYAMERVVIVVMDASEGNLDEVIEKIQKMVGRLRSVDYNASHKKNMEISAQVDLEPGVYARELLFALLDINGVKKVRIRRPR